MRAECVFGPAEYLALFEWRALYGDVNECRALYYVGINSCDEASADDVNTAAAIFMRVQVSAGDVKGAFEVCYAPHARPSMLHATTE